MKKQNLFSNPPCQGRTESAFVRASLSYCRQLTHGWTLAAWAVLILLSAGRAHAEATIDSISDVTIREDSGNKTNTLTGISGTNTIEVAATSSDTSVITVASVKYTSPGTNGTLVLAPVANANGSATITVTVIDGEPSTNTVTFTATVSAVNDAPSFVFSTNRLAILEDAASQSITNFLTTLSAGPSDESTQTFTFAVNLPAAATNLFSAAPQIDTNGTLSFTLATNKFGTNVLSVVMSDSGTTANGGVDSYTNTFTLAVAGVNDAPSTTLGASTNINEDAGTITIPFTISDVDNTTFTNSVSSSDTNIITASVAPLTGTNLTRTLTLKTVTNAFGSATINLVTDDGSVKVTNSLDVTVAPVNDAPSFTLSTTKLLLSEDAGAQSITNFLTKLSPGATNESDQTFSFTVKVPDAATNLFSVLPTITTNGTLGFTPAADAFGTNTITVIMSDTGGTTNGVDKSTNSFSFNLASVNDKPTISLLTNLLVLSENLGAQTITNFATISVGPTNENSQKISAVTLTVSSNAFFKVLPKLNTTNGDLTFQVASNAYGFVSAKVSVKDNGGTAGGGKDTSDVVSFYFAVTNMNQAPVIAGLTNLVLLENKATNISFTVTDPENANVLVTATSSTNALVGVAVSGTGNKRTLAVTPVANKNGGPAHIEVVANDGVNKVTNSFTVSITSVLSGPSLSSLNNLTINEDSGSTNLTVTVSDLDTDVTNVTLSVTFKDTTLGSGVTTNISGSSRSVVLTPATNAFGNTLVFVSANDGTKAITNSFLFTVNPVNDRPTFELSTNSLTIAEDAGAQTLTSFLTSISVGPTNESKQSIVFNLKPADTNYFSKQPAIDKNGTLTFMTATNKYGTVNIAVWAKDSGGTANGGLDTSVTNTFDLVITNVVEAPVIAAIKNLTILEDAASTNVAFKVTYVDKSLTNLTVTASVSKTNVATVSANATLAEGGTNFFITLTTLTNASGSDTVTIVAADGSLKATNSFLLTVTAVNDKPTFDLVTNSITATKFLYAHTISGLFTNIDMGAPDETNQTYKFVTTVDNKSLFSTQPAISTNGILTFKTSTNSGTASLSIKVQDSGGVKNGGVDTSDTKTLSIVIPSNPFTGLTGDYNGLFFSTNGVNADESGFVYFNVDTVGAFKGYMLIAGKSNIFAGQFDLAEGSAKVSITNAPAVDMDVTLDITPSATETITGSVTNSSWQTALEAVKSVFGTATLAPDIGDYTIVIPGSTNSAAAPGGDGYAWATVNVSGLIAMHGALGDGSAISQQVGISKAGEWPLYAPVYNKGTNGSILSWVTFNLTNTSSVVDSNTVSWTKKAAAAGSTYASGFEFDTYPIASTFFPWEGPGLSSATVILSGGNLTTPITNTVTVGFDSIVVDPSATNKLSLVLDPTTGSVSGSFVDPARNATNSIHALLLQQLSVARGYFVGTNETGAFLMK